MTRQSRKDLLKREDAFIVAAEGGAAWLRKHRTPLFTGLGAVLAVGLTAWVVMIWTQHRGEQAALVFAQGWKILDQGVVKPNDPNADATPAAKAADAKAADTKPAATKAKAKSGTAVAEEADGHGKTAKAKKKSKRGKAQEDDAEVPADAPTFPTEKDQWLAARQKFQEVVADAGLKGIGVLAAFLIADLDDKLQEPDAAEKILADLRVALPSRDHLYFLAAERYAYLREAQGDWDGALAALDSVAADDQHFYADHAQFHQARIYVAKKEPDKARSLLDHMAKSFPNSSIIEEINYKLHELGGSPEDAVPSTSAPPSVPEQGRP